MLTTQDIAAIAAFLDLSQEQFVNRWAKLAPNRGQLCLIENEHGVCCFLKNNRCWIYPVRPRQCRDYPEQWRVLEDCPGFA